MINCKSCNHPVTENFCSSCGLPAKLKRIDSHYIMHEIIHVLHLEKGIFYTIKELLLRPGQNVKAFISENRSRLVKPIIFIIISSLIYTIIAHLFHIEDGYIVMSGDEIKEGSATFALNSWVQNHYGYANIIMGMFIAFWLKVFFKKYDYNFFEIVILLCFVMGMGMLLFSVFAIIEAFTKIHLMQISAMIFFPYATWAIGQFFDKKKVSSYLKAFGAYMLGALTFQIGVMLLGTVIDLIFKH